MKLAVNAYDEVPFSCPPVKFIEPDIFIEPVNMIVSTLDENTVDPADPVRNVDPVTINEPDIIALPVYGNVVSGAHDADIALEALVANDADTAFNT